MEVLDGDEKALVSSRGVVQERDNVQFVPYVKFGKSATRLQREVLYELPTQVLEYFGERHVQPNTPLAAAGIPTSYAHCATGLDPAVQTARMTKDFVVLPTAPPGTGS